MQNRVQNWWPVFKICTGLFLHMTKCFAISGGPPPPQFKKKKHCAQFNVQSGNLGKWFLICFQPPPPPFFFGGVV